MFFFFSFCHFKLKLYLLSNTECACLRLETNLKDLGEVLAKSKCETDEWSIYWATHLNAEATRTMDEFELSVAKSLRREPIEIGDPVGLNITLSKSDNYRVYVDFDDGTSKCIVGSGYVHHEYKEQGTNYVNITAVSLASASQRNEIIELRVDNKIDRQPMYSARLSVRLIGERQIECEVTVAGGMPYSCFLNMGESRKRESLDSVGRLSTFKREHTYAQTGVYNVSVLCRSEYINGSEAGDWQLIYLPDPEYDSSRPARLYTR
jgi:hypothetical protein